MNKGLFLDRDGTLIEDVHYLRDPKDIKTIDGVGHAVLQFVKAGFLIFLHTNQSGIARGYYDWSDVHACNRKMLEMLGLPEDIFKEVCVAPEDHFSPGGYRKPSPRFQNEMINKYDLEVCESWMVGDKWIDVETGVRAGIKTCLVRSGKTIDKKMELIASNQGIPIFCHLLEFMNIQFDFKE